MNETKPKKPRKPRQPRQPKLPTPLESEIQDSLKEWLELQGALVIRINSGAIKATYKGKTRFVKFNKEPGCADLLICYRGRFISIEVKRPGTTTEPERALKQEAFRQKVIRAGGAGIKAESIEEARRRLAQEFSINLL